MGRSRVLVLAMAVAVCATVAMSAAGGAAAAPRANADRGSDPAGPIGDSNGGPGDYADAIASKIIDPSFLRLFFDLGKEAAPDPNTEAVLRELAEVNKRLDALDHKLDDIAADVAEIRTNQYWIELQKFMSVISYVQEELVDIGKDADVEDRQARSRAMANVVLDKLTPYRKLFQNFVLAPGGRKGIIPAISDQQKVGVRFWGPKNTENLSKAYESYSAFQALLAAEVAQAKVALATTPALKEKAEADAREISKETKEVIAAQVKELPKGMSGNIGSYLIDLKTHLMWWTNPGAAPIDWGRANAEAAGAAIGGLTGWKLPSNDDYNDLGPGCFRRDYRQPCPFAADVAAKGWTLPASCQNRAVWWTTTLELGRPAGLWWINIPPNQGQTAHDPGNACMLLIRPIGSGESYWM